MLNEIHHGDALEVMRDMEENSVDAVVCDPPYGLFFMGRSWDKGTPPVPFWQEALRVAKPGAYLLAFGGTRTFHRLACAIEDAGWILKDTLSWNYGSGFPKSHDISKAIDRKAGAEREVVGKAEDSANRTKTTFHGAEYKKGWTTNAEGERLLTAPATPEAKQWSGWGTALKPAWEPIILAQAPLEGTYAENVLRWGCGALNIDACRIGSAGRPHIQSKSGESMNAFGDGLNNSKAIGVTKQGRWPANFLLSHSVFCEKVGEREVKKETIDVWCCVPNCPVRMLDEQSGFSKTKRTEKPSDCGGSTWGGTIQTKRGARGYTDQGGASRFFYCAKASRSERNAGLEGQPDRIQKRVNPGGLEHDPRWAPKVSKNNHPTVKPIALLRYLCRLVTPPNGLILDPFAGSGSTGCAAALEGFDFTGIEKEKEYVEIARARIKHWAQEVAV